MADRARVLVRHAVHDPKTRLALEVATGNGWDIMTEEQLVAGIVKLFEVNEVKCGPVKSRQQMADSARPDRGCEARPRHAAHGGDDDRQRVGNADRRPDGGGAREQRRAGKGLCGPGRGPAGDAPTAHGPRLSASSVHLP